MERQINNKFSFFRPKNMIELFIVERKIRLRPSCIESPGVFSIFLPNVSEASLLRDVGNDLQSEIQYIYIYKFVKRFIKVAIFFTILA